MEYNDISSMNIYLSYQDTDITGSIYHCKYLDFAEKARSKLMRGLFDDLSLKNGDTWAVSNTNMIISGYPHVDDGMAVKTLLHKISKASIVFKHNFIVKKSIICSVNAQLVCLDSNLKLKKIDQFLIDKLLELPNDK